MTQVPFQEQLRRLFASQDVAAQAVFEALPALPAGIKLCGETALSRFYLQHRLS